MRIKSRIFFERSCQLTLGLVIFTHVTRPSLEGCTDWIINTKSVEPDLA